MLNFEVVEDQESNVYNLSSSGELGDSEQDIDLGRATLEENNHFQFTVIAAVKKVTN